MGLSPSLARLPGLVEKHNFLPAKTPSNLAPISFLTIKELSQISLQSNLAALTHPLELRNTF